MLGDAGDTAVAVSLLGRQIHQPDNSRVFTMVIRRAQTKWAGQDGGEAWAEGSGLGNTEQLRGT